MKYIFTLSLIFLGYLGMAQNNSKVTPDARLYDVFSAGYITQVQENNPFLIQRWNYYLNHAFEIVEVKNEEKKANLPVVKIKDTDNVNILLLEQKQGLTRDFKKRMYYRIAKSDKVLYYYSGEQFNKNLNKHLARKSK